MLKDYDKTKTNLEGKVLWLGSHFCRPDPRTPLSNGRVY